MRTLLTILALITATLSSASAFAGEVKLYGYMIKHRTGPYYIGYTSRGLDSHVSFEQFNPAQIANIRACYDRGAAYAVAVVKYEAPVGSFGKSYVVSVGCERVEGFKAQWMRATEFRFEAIRP